ncbi:MAG: TauD/TfdA family dioxygenase [Frankiaceae bacterium]
MTPNAFPARHALTDAERRVIVEAVRAAPDGGDAAASVRLLSRGLLERLREMMTDPAVDALLVSGLPLADGPKAVLAPDELDQVLLAAGCALGTPMAWPAYQAGAFVQDVRPTASDVGKQLGTGSRRSLELHTEAAFDPLSPDWILLAAVRNPRSVPTVIATVSALGEAVRDVLPLFEDRYAFPHVEHLREVLPPDVAATLTVDGVRAEWIPRPVLTGERDHPEMDFDRYYFDDPDDPSAKHCLDRLEATLVDAAVEVPLRPGDVLAFDNRRVAHGRPAFIPTFDDTDRWLKRVCVLRAPAKLRLVSEAGGDARCLLLGTPIDLSLGAGEGVSQ